MYAIAPKRSTGIPIYFTPVWQAPVLQNQQGHVKYHSEPE